MTGWSISSGPTYEHTTEEHEERETSHTTTSTTETKTFTKSSAVITEKTDKDSDETNFVTLFIEYRSARSSVLELWAWLVEIMQANEDTIEYVDLTKYLIYKATGKDYGVTEFNFESFLASSSSLSSVTSSSLLEKIKTYIQYWEGSTGTNSDGTMYKIVDIGDGVRTVGHGINLTANTDYDNQLKAAGYDTSIGSYVPVEMVDEFETEILKNVYENVVSGTSDLNLTAYQIAVLVSRAYNCGNWNYTCNGMNFIQAYNAYWSEDLTEEFYGKYTSFSQVEDEDMYTNYMYKPNTSGGTVWAGLVRRRKSEWLLFSTGYDDTIDELWSASYGGEIVECAISVHEYLRTNGYYYAQARNTRTKLFDENS